MEQPTAGPSQKFTPQEEQQQWDDAQRVLRSYECACGGVLGSAYTPDRGWYVRCGRDPAHTEWRTIRSLTRMAREGETLPVSAAAGHVERIVGRLDLARMPSGTAIALAMKKFPDLVNQTDAAIFLGQAAQLGLNPFLGEAVPLVFNKNDPRKRSVAFFVNGDGWATLAACEEPELWAGGPTLRRVTDNEEKIRLGFTKEDWVVEARGVLKGQPDPKVHVSAWTPSDAADAKEHHQTYAAWHPWEMAEARASRRWFRNFFRGAMGKAQRVQAAALEGVDAKTIEGFQSIIEGEYRVMPDASRKPTPPTPPPAAASAPAPASTASAPGQTQGDRCSRETLVRLQQAADPRGWTINQAITEAKKQGVDWYTMSEADAQRLLVEWAG